MPAQHAREACTRVRREALHQNEAPCGPRWCMVPLGVAGAACTPLDTRGSALFRGGAGDAVVVFGAVDARPCRDLGRNGIDRACHHMCLSRKRPRIAGTRDRQVGDQKNRMAPAAIASESASLPLCAFDLVWVYSPISVTQLVRP